jgi:hypothetical protein
VVRLLNGIAGLARRVRGGVLFVSALLLSLALVIAPARSQTLSDAERADLLKQQAQLFQQMLKKPSDLDVAFKYADVSARLGDNEAAVTALERMLLFNPNLPRVQLELGALYFRMGSFQISRDYFDKAAASNPPPEVQSRINEYLGQIQKLSSGSQFSGFVFFGAQYQTDANVGPGSPTLTSPVAAVALSLSNEFVKQPDTSLFLTTSLFYSYDLETQNHDTIDVIGTAFGNHYFKFGRLDLALGEVTAGPRFNFPDPGLWAQTATVRPYVILNEVGLGGNQYFYTYGVGGEVGGIFPDNLTLTGRLEAREKHFSNASDRPVSTNFNGNDKLLSLLASKGITDNSVLTLEFDYLDQSTVNRVFSNYTLGVSGNYRIRYDDPTGTLKFPWETVFTLARSWGLYQAPDPFFGSVRDDRRWRVGLTQNFQVLDNLTLTVQLQRDIVSSNQGLYPYTSDSVLVGPQIRF